MQALGQGEGGGGGRPEPKHLWSMQRFVQSIPVRMLSSVCTCATLCDGERLGAHACGCRERRWFADSGFARARIIARYACTRHPSCDTLVQTSFAHTDHGYAHRFIRYWTLERKRNVAILPPLGGWPDKIHLEAIAQK